MPTRFWGHWVINETFKYWLGNVSTVFTMGMFFSPIKTFYGIVKVGSTEQFSCTPYMVTFANCALWVYYGLRAQIPPAYITNIIGVSMETIFVLMYLYYCSPTQKRYVFPRFMGMLVALAMLMIIPWRFDHYDINVNGQVLSIFLVGTTASVMNILMYGSPLTVMKLVMETRSVRYMPFSLSLFGFIASILWFGVGFYQGDVFITVPNVCGIFLGIAQLLLYARYYNTKESMQAYNEVTEPFVKDKEINDVVGDNGKL